MNIQVSNCYWFIQLAAIKWPLIIHSNGSLCNEASNPEHFYPWIVLWLLTMVLVAEFEKLSVKLDLVDQTSLILVQKQNTWVTARGARSRRQTAPRPGHRLSPEAQLHCWSVHPVNKLLPSVTQQTTETRKESYRSHGVYAN